MNWTDVVQALAAIFGTLLAAAGFITVIVQLRNLRQTIRVANRATIYQMTERLKSTLLENYELRGYFFADRPVDANDDARDRIVAVADYVVTYLELIATHQHEIEPENRDAWVEFIRMIYRKSPVVQELLAERRNTFSSVFWGTIEGN